MSGAFIKVDQAHGPLYLNLKNIEIVRAGEVVMTSGMVLRLSPEQMAQLVEALGAEA